MKIKDICIFLCFAVSSVEPNGEPSLAPFKQDVQRGEFPHVALLGYSQKQTSSDDSSEVNDLSWYCGGTVISDSFVLTAGHCTKTLEFSDHKLTHVAVGVIKRSDIQPSRVYRVTSVHTHPEYNRPVKYNDIGIVEIEDTFHFTTEVQPACLSTVQGDYDKAFVIGLAPAIAPDSDGVVQKTAVTQIKSSECNKLYSPKRKLERGVDDTTMVCYGGSEPVTDQGDGGAPVQVLNNNSKCKHTVIGILSFGILGGNTDVYTRVAPYLPWINSVVQSAV